MHWDRAVHYTHTHTHTHTPSLIFFLSLFFSLSDFLIMSHTYTLMSKLLHILFETRQDAWTKPFATHSLSLSLSLSLSHTHNVTLTHSDGPNIAFSP